MHELIVWLAGGCLSVSLSVVGFLKHKSYHKIPQQSFILASALL
jgi:hypothetical protein